MKHRNTLQRNSLRSIAHLDYAAIKKNIDICDFSPIMEENGANNATDKLISVIQNMVSKYTKHKKVSRRTRILKPWITEGMLRCIRNHDKMHLNVKQV